MNMPVSFVVLYEKMLLSLALLPFLVHFTTGDIRTKLFTHYTSVPRLVCESLLYRTLYRDSDCYFIIDADADLNSTATKCAKALAKSKLSEDTPDYVYSSLFAVKGDFLLNNDSKGKKKAMCYNSNPFPKLSESKPANSGRDVALAKQILPITAQAEVNQLYLTLTEIPVPGQVFVFKGIFHPEIFIDLMHIKRGIPLVMHLKQDCVVLASNSDHANAVGDTWDIPDRTCRPHGFTVGGVFDIRIRFLADAFQIFFNMKEFTIYKFRRPLEWITAISLLNTADKARFTYVDLGGNNIPFPNTIVGSSQMKDFGVVEKTTSNKMALPYTRQFTEKIEPGHNLTVKGDTYDGVEDFFVNLQSGDGKAIALRIIFRFEKGTVTHNSVGRYGIWGDDETLDLPISKDSPFELLIRFSDDRFQIFVNQREFSVYRYRVPISTITHINVKGLGYLNSIKLVGEKYTPAPVEHLIPGLPVCVERYCSKLGAETTSAPTFKSYASLPQTNDCKPVIITGMLPSELPYWHSSIVKFSSLDRPVINLMRKNGDIALHIAIEFAKNDVVLAFLRDNRWQDIEVVNKFPFKKDELFEVAITNEAAGFQIFVNGTFLASYKHRMSSFDIATVDTAGVHNVNIRT